MSASLDDLADARPATRLLTEWQDMQLLRFITCGSVDDGKSTLIGRLLYDSKTLFDDELEKHRAARTLATAGSGGEAAAGEIDFAHLVDGLQAEREQGITIDVAHRFFATARRRFIIADTPGHEQYTRNMATAASTADLAVLLVDARKGILTQTRRHSFIAHLLGIRTVVLAVNKMDLMDYAPDVFRKVEASYRAYAEGIGIPEVTAIPVSALKGDNILARSAAMPWYDGPTLMEYLDTVPLPAAAAAGPFRLPVQWVNRPHLDFRGYSGTVARGTVRPGDPVVVQPAGRRAQVARVVTMDGDLAEASAGEAVTLTLTEEVDVGRGDVIAAAESPAALTDQFAANLIWMADQPMMPGRKYLLKTGAVTVPATVTELKHRIDVNSLEHVSAKQLRLNEVGSCNLGLEHAIACDPYAESRTMGSFILVDRYSNETVGTGMVAFSLRRAANLTWQALDIDKAARAQIKSQKPCILWFTGLSGAGKSTVANVVEKWLHAHGHHTYVLDGDNVRHGLNKDLGFTEADRVENVRRVAEVARLLVDAGLIVIVSLISPFRSERQMARELVAEGEFIEVFVDTPVEECERRDPKGLYRKARAGQIVNFTGVDSPYEPPENPEIHIRTLAMSPGQEVEAVIGVLQERGIVG